jgi:hypothetical protein
MAYKVRSDYCSIGWVHIEESQNQVTKTQVLLDRSVIQLIEEMDESCRMAREAAPLKERSNHVDKIITQILQQVIQCTYFVKDYCSEQSFGA